MCIKCEIETTVVIPSQTVCGCDDMLCTLSIRPTRSLKEGLIAVHQDCKTEQPDGAVLEAIGKNYIVYS